MLKKIAKIKGASPPPPPAHGFQEKTNFHVPGYMNLKKKILMCSSGGGGGPAQKKIFFC